MSDRKEYYEKNKDKFKQYRKRYHQENKDKINARKRKYSSRPEVKERRSKRSAEIYKKNRKETLERNSKRRQHRKAFLDFVCLHYGCKNPNCKWSGAFHPSQLTFHHVDRQSKIIEVAKMHSWSLEKILDEIEKCVVLCRNCHTLADLDKFVFTSDDMCKRDYFLEVFNVEQKLSKNNKLVLEFGDLNA